MSRLSMSADAPVTAAAWWADLRVRALLAVVTLVIAGGAFVYWLPRDRAPAKAQAPDPHAAVVDRHFRQGVAMLHAKQYEHAVTAFHQVLRYAPQLPEAHVNMGFALLGMGKHAAARDFFNSATELRPNQANAYYGMGLAHETLGDLDAALGAMRTYVHLAPAGDPYRRKADAAIWEMSEARDKRRAETKKAKP